MRAESDMVERVKGAGCRTAEIRCARLHGGDRAWHGEVAWTGRGELAYTFIEEYRQKQIRDLHTMKTFGSCWPTWLKNMRTLTNDFSDANAIWELGQHLAKTFQLTGKGRSQSSLSGGGAAWEGLVCWYLNVVFAGTPGLALKPKKALVPQTILDAATVKYGNYKTNTESDLYVIVLPDDLSFSKSGKALETLDQVIKSNLGGTDLAIVQCKTNWNDNAQIPMLWDMVYQGTFPSTSTVHIGTACVKIQKMKSFRYSFVVVPSQKGGFTPNSMAVHRLRGMTGGNYWGLPSQKGVAQALGEIFTDNFDHAFSGTVQHSIQNAISNGLILPLWNV
jgi:hypothetical protein